MTTAHSKAIWREPVGSGVTAGPAYLVSSGADVIPSAVGPEEFAFYDVEQNGNYWLLKLAPVYLVDAGGGNATPSLVGPAVWILIDDGAGGVTLSTDLTQTPIADLLYDTGGNLWLVRRTVDRLNSILFNGNVQFY